MTCFIKQDLKCLNEHDTFIKQALCHITSNSQKCIFEANVTVTSFEDNFFLISLEAR
jgi:hypothetical protein